MILILLVLLFLFSVFCFLKAKKMMNAENKNVKQVFSEFSINMEEIKKEQEQSFSNKNVVPSVNFITSDSAENSLADDFKRLNRLYQKGENTDELEELEAILHSKVFKIFLYEEPSLDIPVKVLNLAGKFITDSYTLNFLASTPFNEYIFEEHGDRYDDVIDSLKDSKKILTKTLPFRTVIENNFTLENLKKELDNLFLTNKKLLNDTFCLNDDENWKNFKKADLTISDYLLATSFYNHGNTKAYELYLNNFRTQDDYKKLTIEDLISLNFKVKKTQEKIMTFRDFYINLSDIRDIWLFRSDYKEWKEKMPLSELEKINLVGVDSL